MIEYIKQNKWSIILISFLILNVGYMIYSHEMKKEVVQLEGSNLVLAQESYEESEQSQNEKIDEEIDVRMLSQVQVIEQVPIYICGAINNPGVYYFPADALVNDVVERGGGFTEEADQMAINLASQIIPNEKIIVPKIGEEIDKSTDSYDNRERVESSFVSPQADTSLTQVIDLNTATKEQLMTLNGIGEVKAAAIIAYRQEKGMFQSIEELKNVSGIGEKTFEKIKQFITT